MEEENQVGGESHSLVLDMGILRCLYDIQVDTRKLAVSRAGLKFWGEGRARDPRLGVVHKRMVIEARHGLESRHGC